MAARSWIILNLVIELSNLDTFSYASISSRVDT
jgi:hypothetical protein